MAVASMKPPINRKMSGLAKALKAVEAGTMPMTTASVGPRSAVTGRGSGSVIHHKATSVIKASSLWAARDKSGMGVKKTRRAQIGAPNRPMVRLLRSNADVWLNIGHLFHIKSTCLRGRRTRRYKQPIL